MDVIPTLKEGEKFPLSGEITSSGNRIKAISALVYDTAGNTMLSADAYTDAQSYNLSQISLAFENLPAGEYIYRVFVAVVDGKATPLVYQEFTITPRPVQEDALILSGGTVTTDMVMGTPMFVQGVITSSVSKLSSVTVGIFDADGVMVTGNTVTPDALVYDVAALDAFVTFDRLPAGSYEYRVIASNATYTDYVLANQYFRVISPGEDTLTLERRFLIPNLVCGNYVNLGGTATSTGSVMTELIAGVYRASGEVVKEQRIAPNAQTCELHDIDAQSLFTGLAPGTYYLRISASNATYLDAILCDYKFTVSALAK